MCTLVICRRPAHPWPLILGANRDERIDRPWLPPGRHWPDWENVTGGLDETAGGSWLGVNDHGLVAAVLNRVGTLGPAEGKRSRGELVLQALDHADAGDAARALGQLNPDAYRPFNLVVGDNRDAFWVAHRGGEAAIAVLPIEEGISMLTARDLNDPTSPRVRRYLKHFQWAGPPDPETGDWQRWESLLASEGFDPAAGPEGAMHVRTDTGFGTVSSSVLAIPAPASIPVPPVWRFADATRTPLVWRAVEGLR
ncbi:MAG TPA: NRDE family protein [Stellaceae bacterium]|nr:NRDE family protein [Stellaceae bacterium]